VILFAAAVCISSLNTRPLTERPQSSLNVLPMRAPQHIASLPAWRRASAPTRWKSRLPSLK